MEPAFWLQSRFSQRYPQDAVDTLLSYQYMVRTILELVEIGEAQPYGDRPQPSIPPLGKVRPHAILLQPRNKIMRLHAAAKEVLVLIFPDSLAKHNESRPSDSFETIA